MNADFVQLDRHLLPQIEELCGFALNLVFEAWPGVVQKNNDSEMALMTTVYENLLSLRQRIGSVLIWEWEPQGGEYMAYEFGGRGHVLAVISPSNDPHTSPKWRPRVALGEAMEWESYDSPSEARSAVEAWWVTEAQRERDWNQEPSHA